MRATSRNGPKAGGNRPAYAVLLRAILARPAKLLTVVALTVAASAGMFMFVGNDYFPQIDAGQPDATP
ncbi:MAG TPA: hypothetical protein VGH36_12775 [Acetobacteraceae bacterium]|jgi:Cu/Ag efflux pump CusA